MSRQTFAIFGVIKCWKISIKSKLRWVINFKSKTFERRCLKLGLLRTAEYYVRSLWVSVIRYTSIQKCHTTYLHICNYFILLNIQCKQNYNIKIETMRSLSLHEPPKSKPEMNWPRFWQLTRFVCIAAKNAARSYSYEIWSQIFTSPYLQYLMSSFRWRGNVLETI